MWLATKVLLSWSKEARVSSELAEAVENVTRQEKRARNERREKSRVTLTFSSSNIRGVRLHDDVHPSVYSSQRLQTWIQSNVLAVVVLYKR